MTEELRRLYDSKVPAFERARERLLEILHEVARSIEDRNLVRAQVRDVRIKSFESFRSKVVRKSWSADEALSVCSDLVGGRVVCNNVEDVRRFAELLKENSGDVRPLIDEQDYILAPEGRGYRALHLDLKLNVSKTAYDYEIVSCEVQIRTLLQDAWAELAHDDIYKQTRLPEDLEARASDLAEVLAAADRIAGSIRSRALRERTPPADRPALDVVSETTLSFLFKEYFGRAPADYAVRQALTLCERLDLRSLERLPEHLNNDGNEGFPEDVRLTYAKVTGFGLNSNETVFFAAIRALANGRTAANKWIRQQARREVKELDRIVIREMLSELPDTVDEFIESIGSLGEGFSIERWAGALGATCECSVCSTTIVNAYGFAEALIQHYQVLEEREERVLDQIVQAIGQSGVEIGGWGDTSLCAYHHETLRKED